MKRKFNFILFMLFLVVIATTYAATTHEAMVITWQNNAGYWRGVGPVQILSVGESSESRAIDLLTGDEDFSKISVGYPTEIVGKYRIYRLGRALKAHETDAIDYTQRKGYLNWN